MTEIPTIIKLHKRYRTNKARLAHRMRILYLRNGERTKGQWDFSSVKESPIHDPIVQRV